MDDRRRGSGAAGCIGPGDENGGMDSDSGALLATHSSSPSSCSSGNEEEYEAYGEPREPSAPSLSAAAARGRWCDMTMDITTTRGSESEQ